MTMKDGISRLVGTQYASGEEWKNSPRKNKEMEPKRKQHPVVDVYEMFNAEKRNTVQEPGMLGP